jgi:inward rectifier potassium channel
MHPAQARFPRPLPAAVPRRSDACAVDQYGRIANFKVVGKPWTSQFDLVHALLNMSWISVLICLFIGYATLAAFFGLLYYLQPGSIRGSDESFADAFYFSVQTLSTAGYGFLSPQTSFSNLASLVESFCGLTFVAGFTGIVYARISRPQARVAFTNVMCVHDVDGISALVLRVANQRDTQILEARVQISVLVKHSTLEGNVTYQ